MPLNARMSSRILLLEQYTFPANVPWNPVPTYSTAVKQYSRKTLPRIVKQYSKALQRSTVVKTQLNSTVKQHETIQ